MIKLVIGLIVTCVVSIILSSYFVFLKKGRKGFWESLEENCFKDEP